MPCHSCWPGLFEDPVASMPPMLLKGPQYSPPHPLAHSGGVRCNPTLLCCELMNRLANISPGKLTTHVATKLWVGYERDINLNKEENTYYPDNRKVNNTGRGDDCQHFPHRPATLSKLMSGAGESPPHCSSSSGLLVRAELTFPITGLC